MHVDRFYEPNEVHHDRILGVVASLTSNTVFSTPIKLSSGATGPLSLSLSWSPTGGSTTTGFQWDKNTDKVFWVETDVIDSATGYLKIPLVTEMGWGKNILTLEVKDASDNVVEQKLIIAFIMWDYFFFWLPQNISVGFNKNVKILSFDSGLEQRRSMWRQTRTIYSLEMLWLTKEQFEDLRRFYEAVGGTENSFLFYPPQEPLTTQFNGISIDLDTPIFPRSEKIYDSSGNEVLTYSIDYANGIITLLTTDTYFVAVQPLKKVRFASDFSIDTLFIAPEEKYFMKEFKIDLIEVVGE